MAKAKNIQVIPGLEMFVQQGARQFEIWTGKPAPVAEMAYVVTEALERQATAEAIEEQPAPARKAAPKAAPKEATPKKVAPKKSTPKKAAKKSAKPVRKR